MNSGLKRELGAAPIIWAVAVALGGGCAPPPPPESSLGGASERPVVASGKPQELTSAAKRRKGASAPVVWSRGAPRVESSDCALGEITDTLDVVEVRADSDSLYIDLQNAGEAGAGEAVPPDAVPHLGLMVNGCRARSPEVVEVVAFRDDSGPSTLSFMLTDLPDGELDLHLTVFGQAEVVALRKRGRDVRTLALADRHNIRVLDGHDGEEPAVLIEEPECAIAGEGRR